MRQSIKNETHRDKTIANYLRISREDSKTDESYSIANQRKLLTTTAKEMGFTKIIEFVDDGITGTDRDRKAFNQMLQELELGEISTVMVKDLSRLARDHIKADTLIEEVFPEMGIRLISISEGLDTINGEDEFTPFRNLMNEWYSKDISKKRKLTNKVKGSEGIPLSQPPYGYLKDPDDPRRWIIEPEAASVVQRIFSLILDGKGTAQIAQMLTDEGILPPISYWQERGIRRPGRSNSRDPLKWNGSTIVSILDKQEYCGDVLNFKSYSKSFRLKKRIPNAKENMAIFRDVNEPIIERAVWERVQEKRQNKRKRKTKDGEKNMFSGLLVCVDCGRNLQYHFNQKNPDIKYFNCPGNNGTKKVCSTTHYIRVDFLSTVILQEIKRLTRYARQYENELASLVMGHHEQSSMRQLEQKKNDLAKMTRRVSEIDRLFSDLFEANVSGKIDDDRFSRMSDQYTLEQKELSDKIEALNAELSKEESQAMTADRFIATVRKYTRAKKLTERMLNELIDKIEIHHRVKVDGNWQQEITIHYSFIGAIEIPEELTLPEIVTKTRKGVQLNYTPLRPAV